MSLARSFLIVTLGLTLTITFLTGVLSPANATIIIAVYLVASLLEALHFGQTRKVSRSIATVSYVMLEVSSILLFLLYFS
ncbi:hypothetical protein [Shouchella lehensis]|uniref:Uncharacterized protein n=1 Tax=Shouchella lehensis TaxID=300825 RepID=A0A4Y7WI69_9BACI|nr:hypothetical protein [Shouchella lehensis]MBG9782665.1 hypothetical protein [Shouchella lehensis]TES47718.1 hypothetical protein E2L03_11165 [Shouchella lehensis]